MEKCFRHKSAVNGSSHYPKHKDSIHPYSPEDTSYNAQMYWFRYASFYSPASTQFDSCDDLVVKLHTTYLKEKFIQRKQENQRIKEHNIQEWKNIIRKVNKREMPPSYEDALKYYNTTSFF